MAKKHLTLTRTDLFPSGTVKAFKGTQADVWSCDETLKATAAAEATVSSGKLEIELEEGTIYTFYGEVSSAPVYLRVGVVPWESLTNAHGPLKDRLRIRREEVGA